MASMLPKDMSDYIVKAGETFEHMNEVHNDIWLEFNTITVGIGDKKQTFDLVKILKGLEKLGE